MSLLAFSPDGANDAVTAVLVVVVGAMLRGFWSMQQRVSRLEGLDEQRARQLGTSESEIEVKEE